MSTKKTFSFFLLFTLVFYVSEVMACDIDPVADLDAAPINIYLGDSITFDGTNSYDPDGGNIVYYEWDFDYNDITFMPDCNNTIGTTDYIYDSNGVFKVALRVTDDDNATDIDTVIVTATAKVYNSTQQAWYGYIQKALDEANDLDVIKVYPGIFQENIDFNGVNCTVESVDPNDWLVVEATIIHANDSNYATVSFINSEDSNAVLAGFKITGGLRGIECNDASPVVTNCILSGNGQSGSLGGGVYDCNNAFPLITHCFIVENNANYGAGIYNENSSPIIRNSVISKNAAAFDGGGIYDVNSTAEILNCTFTDNDANNGGGMYCIGNESDPNLVNCIFWDNEAVADGNQIVRGTGADPNYKYCDIQDSNGSTSWNQNLGNDDGGNIDQNPCFVTSPKWSDISSGIQGIPYEITNIYELQEIENDLDGYYILTNDINAAETATWNNNTGFSPIGNSETPFTGTFNGMKYSITNLYINRPSNNGQGLFGKLSGATIQDVNIIDANIQCSQGGILAASATMDSTVSGCRVTGNMILQSGSTDSKSGGLVGSIGGSSVVEKCSSGVDINAGYRKQVGSLIGYLRGRDTNPVTRLENSYSSGTVSGNGIKQGNLVGDADGAEVDRCYSCGYYKALLGFNFMGSIVTNSYWDSTTGAASSSYGGTPKTTVEMMQEATYTDWDFTNIWEIKEGQTYPYLKYIYRSINQYRYRLDYNSPCINAGDPSSDMNEVGFYDIDNQPRICEVNGVRIDIGADEYCGVNNITKNTFYPIIQLAIDDSDDGDTIVVSPGVYDKIDFEGKAINIRSTDPNDANIIGATIIDANNTSAGVYAVTFDSGEDANSILDGMSITGGEKGIYCTGSPDNATSPTITNCVIYNNASYGIHLGSYFSPEISKCTITENNYGVFVQYGPYSASIFDCSINQNGNIGIHCQYGSAVISDTNIIGNTYKGVSCINYSSVEMTNCVVARSSYGITITGSTTKPSSITNCTVFGNTTLGITASCSSGTEVKNCILWGNSDDISSGLTWGCVTYCCIEDDEPGLGNFKADPCFVDADSNDFHLDPNSACIDRGEPWADYSNEPSFNGNRLNLGRYGNTSEATRTTDEDSDGLSDAWELYYFGSLVYDSNSNPDDDDFTNKSEYLFGYDPNSYTDESMFIIEENISASQFDPTDNQSVVISYWINMDANSDVSFTGADASVNLVDSVSAGYNEAIWYGKDNNGLIVLDDFYDINIDANDGQGHTANSNPGEVEVYYVHDIENLACNPYRILPLNREVSTITYDITTDANMIVEVYDPCGILFTTLLNGSEQLEANNPQQLIWYGLNGSLGDPNNRYISKEGQYLIRVRFAGMCEKEETTVTAYK